MTPEEFRTFLETVPAGPGVYLFKDSDGTILYVGKALALKARLRSYAPGPATSAKQAFLSGTAASVETVVTRSELEALMLEQTLIQRHHPRHNIGWRDNKTFPSLELTATESFPRLYFTRRSRRKGSRYFGPYTAGAARRLQRLVNQHFRVPSCRVDMDGRQTPCLYHHLGWCDAPCAGLIGREEYAGLVAQARLFLEGRAGELAPLLQRAMDEAAAQEEFEEAARLRDRLRAVEQLNVDQAVVAGGEEDADVLGLARSGSFGCMAVLAIRGGSLVGKQEFTVRRAGDEPDGELVRAFLGQHFTGSVIPPRLLLPCPVESPETVEALLAERRGGAVRLVIPQRGHGRDLVSLATDNARAALVTRGRVGEDEAREQLAAVATALGLGTAPEHIEGVDLSRLGGEEAVGAVVVFHDGLPATREHRRFLIKLAAGDDDYGGMREVVTRRLKRLTAEHTELPGLLLLDGGLGHLRAVEPAVRDLAGDRVAVAALAKREEELYLPGREGPLRLPADSPALHVLQRVRDEAHRYVNAYQRRRRAMSQRADAERARPRAPSAQR